MTVGDRRRLGALSALVVGVFIGLCLVPQIPTGAVGRTLGGLLWKALGAGAVGFPVLGLALAFAGFDRLPRLDMKRTAILLGGLAVIIPFTVGVITEAAPASFDPPLPEWTLAARAAGIVPGLLAYGATGLIGKTGGLLLAFLSVSALTILTLAWHPLRRLEKSEAPAVPLKGPEPAAARTKRIAKPVPTPIVDDDEVVEAKLEPEAKADPKAEKKKPVAKVAKAIKAAVAAVLPTGDENELPPVELLQPPPAQDTTADEAALDKLGQSLMETLRTFKVEGTIAGRTSGPVVTQFEVVPAPGVKAGRIIALADDLAITMRASSIRVSAIPGKEPSASKYRTRRPEW